mgnify:FL=1|tara:strand:- start:1169 stop:1432 length:264 start_codon:yes stop_codon:yes gene_type:complete
MITTTVSKRATKFADQAMTLAKTSPMLFRHGCVCVVNGKVISTGVNNYRTHCCSGMIDSCSCHAEMDAVRKIIKGTKGTPAKVAKTF